MFLSRAAVLVLTLLFTSHLAQGASCDTATGSTIDPRPLVNGWGVNSLNHRFIPESSAGVTPANVHTLRPKWVFALPDTDAPRFLPLVTPDTLVIGDAPGMVYALDRETGCEKWRFDAGAMVRTAFRYIVHEGEHLVVFGTLQAELIALDLLTGRQKWRLRVDEHPRAMISGSAVDHAGVIYQPVSSWELYWAANPFYACCTFRSSVVAVSAESGELLWRAYTIEQAPAVVKARRFLPDHMGPSGAPVWSQPTLDIKRQRLYVGTGENYSSPATDTSDAILAFDLRDGNLLWKQQFLANDAWNVACVVPGHINCPEERGEDLDFGAPPILARAGERDVILAGQKSGRVFALDPDDEGRLLWSGKPGAGGKAGGVHFAMAVDPQREILYVPISDRPVGAFGDSADGEPNPSLHAIAIASGKTLWETTAPGDCMDDHGDGAVPEIVDDCYPGFSAAVTVTDNLVFAPTLDGYLRVFDAANGRELWSFDTRGEYPAVNGGQATGGALDLGGVFLDGGQLFVSSGYGQFGQIPGNAFMVFEVSQDRAAIPEHSVTQAAARGL